MSLFIQKALLWNTNNYQGPSGVKAQGFPETTGFGVEEWNNSPHLLHPDGDVRAFYTHEIGKCPADEHVGQMFVFMTASHGGNQFLVGVAGRATSLIDDKYTKARKRLVKKLGLQHLWEEAWPHPFVKEHFKTKQALQKKWLEEVEYLPRWLCPESMFWWPDEPIKLDALHVTGKQRFLSRFKGYASFTRDQVDRLMNSVPQKQRDAKWHDLLDAMHVAPDHPTTEEDLPGAGRDITTRMALVAQRVGQDQFKRDLMRRWNRRCSVSGLSIERLLRASHILPWSQSKSAERLDPENGLLLTPNLDALFDAHLISFTDEGAMLVSESIGDDHSIECGLPRPLLQAPTEGMKKYLAGHRSVFYSRSNF